TTSTTCWKASGNLKLARNTPLSSHLSCGCAARTATSLRLRKSHLPSWIFRSATGNGLRIGRSADCTGDGRGCSSREKQCKSAEGVGGARKGKSASAQGGGSLLKKTLIHADRTELGIVLLVLSINDQCLARRACDGGMVLLTASW